MNRMIFTAHFGAQIIEIYGYQAFSSMKPVVANEVSNYSFKFQRPIFLILVKLFKLFSK